MSEDEIYADFKRIYRAYKGVHRKWVGDYFFKETEDIVDKLCDDFEKSVLAESDTPEAAQQPGFASATSSALD